MHGCRKLPISKPRSRGTTSSSSALPPQRSLASAPTILGPLDAVAEKLGNEIDYDIVADVIEISAGGASIRAAALVAPGHADDSLSIALGYGRKLGSTLFDGAGFDAYPLRLSTSPRFRTGVAVRVTGEHLPARANAGAPRAWKVATFSARARSTASSTSQTSPARWAWMATSRRTSRSTPTPSSPRPSSGA